MSDSEPILPNFEERFASGIRKPLELMTDAELTTGYPDLTLDYLHYLQSMRRSTLNGSPLPASPGPVKSHLTHPQPDLLPKPRSYSSSISNFPNQEKPSPMTRSKERKLHLLLPSILVCAGLATIFGYHYSHSIRGFIQSLDILNEDLRHPVTPQVTEGAPTFTPAIPTMESITITAPPPLKESTQYKPTQSPTHSLDSLTPSPEGGNNSEPPKHSFNENMLSLDQATIDAKYSHVGLSEGTVLCLDQSGDTIAINLGDKTITDPLALDSPLTGCAIVHNGAIRTISIDPAPGNQLLISRSGDNPPNVIIATQSLAQQKDFQDWGWLDPQGVAGREPTRENLAYWVKSYLLARRGQLYVENKAGQVPGTGRVKFIVPVP